MIPEFTLKKEIAIKAPVSKVWNALTNHVIIKQYFFGTDFITDWRKGSPILFNFNPTVKPHVDKANIPDIEKGEFISFNYWSSSTRTLDIPENYTNFSYKLSSANGMTILTVTQDKLKDEEDLECYENNWDWVMVSLKEILEFKADKKTTNR